MQRPWGWNALAYGILRAGGSQQLEMISKTCWAWWEGAGFLGRGGWVEGEIEKDEKKRGEN